MIKLSKFATLLAVVFFSFLSSCSSSDDGGDIEAPDINTEENVVVDDNDGNTETDEMIAGIDTSSLTEMFVFDENIYIENSYFEGECDRIPCETDDEPLDEIFDNGNVPDDVYFSLSEDQTELVLQCLPDLGRRIEFKQRSEGSLNVPASLEMEGVFEYIPDEGITIAQVHNRGAARGNKPYFRLVLFKSGLETVIRDRPVVPSRESTFSRIRNIPFYNGEVYDLTPLTITVSKGEGAVQINVRQEGVSILSETFSPGAGSEWITDNGIANGFYLKGGIYNDDDENEGFTDNLVARFTRVIFASEDTDEI